MSEQSKDPKVQELYARKAAARQGGGPERIARQHARGKMTARERIELLVDKGSFREIDVFVTHKSEDSGLEKIPGDGVVTGYETIDKRLDYIYSQSITVLGSKIS